MKSILIFTVFYLSSILMILSAQSPGSLDITFGTDGKIQHNTGLKDLLIYQSVLKENGSVIVTGKAKETGASDESVFVAVLKPDGDLDNSFNNTGYRLIDLQMTEDVGKSLALQSNGKIVIAGWVHNGANFDIGLIRNNPDGSVDNGFGNSGKLIINMGSTEFGMVVKILPGDKILLVSRRYNGINSDIALMRFLPDGMTDTSFGVNGLSTMDFSGSHEYPYDCVLLNDGSIVVAGDSEKSGYSVFFAAKFSKDGVPVSTFGNNGFVAYQVGTDHNGVSSVKVQTDGKIVIGGYAYEGSETSFALVRLSSDGTPDHTFGSGGSVTTDIRDGSEYISDIMIQNDGKILVSGVGRGLVSNSDFAIARYLADGSSDMSFGVNGLVFTDFGNTDMAANILPVSDDRFMIAGNADNVNLVMARYHNNQPSSSHELIESIFNIYPNPAKSMVNIKLSEFGNDPVSIVLKNSEGSSVKLLSAEPLTEEIIQVALPENLPSGTYFISLSQNQLHVIKKVIVL
ncbi:MAG: T9SS type A sorting domain-containing protein [Saprospiraceae bacterium]|nr:T9SS type A sorting domain-containing protein [Saprospiraceae bacterium]